MVIAAILIAVGFLSGSLPTGIVVSRLTTGRDVRKSGSGNFGAANVARTAGFKIGILVAVIDILKGTLPVLIGVALGLDHVALALVALAAVLGHDFSIVLAFRGGKGVATTVGVALVLAPVPTILAAAVWIAIMLGSRYSSVASLAALIVLPIASFATGRPVAYVLALIVLCLLGIGKHWENIVRLAQGKEQKFRARPTDGV